MTDPTVDADSFNAFEAAGWEAQVAGYDEFFVPITTRLVGPLLDATGVGGGDRVLDVASGPGHVAAGAAGRGASVIGVDIAEGMLSLARRLHPELEFRRGDAEALPFPDGSFDAVVANFLMLHVGRPEQVVAEFARVLVPDGRLALTVWDVPGAGPGPRRAPRGGGGGGSQSAPGHPHRAAVLPVRGRRGVQRAAARPGGSRTSWCAPSPSRTVRPLPRRSGKGCSEAPSGRRR